MAANNKNRNENTKPTPKPVDAATSTIMTLYSALFFLTIVVATLGVFFVYSFRGLFDDMTFYYLAIYFFASATLLLLSSLACIFTMQAVRLGHRLHLTTRRTLQVCLGFLLLHLLYDILLLLYFGVLAMQLWDVETSTDDVGGNGEPLSVHEKVIGGLFNEMFFNLVIYCEGRLRCE
ncbi:hypothetical protein EON65_24105 [archaeon]|nr:MAG: hypothetical protein EON65_24105 [archaeon]